MKQALGAALALVVVFSGGCSRRWYAPVEISHCSMKVMPVANGYEERYTFFVRNKTSKTVLATRIGSMSWVDYDKPMPDEIGGIMTIDDFIHLGPYQSHYFYVHTGLQPNPANLHTAPMPCRPISVTFTNDDSWSAKPGWVAPPDRWQPDLIVRPHVPMPSRKK